MTGDRSLRDYDLESGDEAVIDDPLVFLAQPDSLIVTDEFAKRNGLHADSTDRARHDGRRPGVHGPRHHEADRPRPARSAATSRSWTSTPRSRFSAAAASFDRMDLAVRDGVTVDEGRAAIERALGPGFEVAPPSARGQQFESICAVYSISMNITSVFALFIGMFIIYNSFPIAVTQRRSEIGILRALGATRPQIRTLFLGESAVAGLIGSAVGFSPESPWRALWPARSLLGEVYGIAAAGRWNRAQSGLDAFALVARRDDEYRSGLHAREKRRPR